MITYNESKKDLPVDQLYRLFYLAGWTGSESSTDPDMLKISILLLLTQRW